MKKLAILFAMIISMAGLTACASAHANESDQLTIEMEMDKDYDVTDPFVNARLFCVSEDLDSVTAVVSLKMDGERGSLEVKNNKTNEVLWSKAWSDDIDLEPFAISLEDLKKENEYAIYFTGTKIDNAAMEMTFESDLVKERERPL